VEGKYSANLTRGSTTTVRDNKYITKIVAASLLGDGYLNRTKTEHQNSYFELKQLSIHKDYIDHISEILQDITSITTDIVNSHIDSRGFKSNERIRIRTKTHPFYTKFRHRMYPNGHKVIDPHYLTLLDAEFLAHLFMEDGSKYTQDGKYHRIVLCSESFSFAENIQLSKAIEEKLGVKWFVKNHVSSTSGNHCYRLQLWTKDVEKFCKLIEPFIQPSFYYKINLSNDQLRTSG
jgi:hypothetical protein